MLGCPVNYMEHALSLAELALGYTSPNPAVGAVVVKNGQVVGLGHTQPPGSAHAEIMAIKQAGEKARGATMYISLEPCCHYGRTPPCTKHIINAGISTVHIALLDPNPAVSGNGVEELKNAGIKVVVGEYEQKAREINEGYLKYITTGYPFVVAKFGISVDGKIATKSGDSRWITGEEARRFVHMLRHMVDAIMVGANTVIVDNPRLSARKFGDKGGKTKIQPLRVVVDGRGRISPSSKLFKEPGETLVAVAKPLEAQKKEQLIKAGAEVIELEAYNTKVDLKKLMKLLGDRKITNILVEGGSELFGSLFDQGLIDKVHIYVSPIIIGGDGAKSAIGGMGAETIDGALRLQDVKIRSFGDEVMITGYLRKS